MATQRRFEAGSLAAVLAKVQKEIGPNAKIASAQRVRTGGVGGFFQREKFEVIVDTSESATTAATPTASAGSGSAGSKTDENYDAVTSLLGLAEKINQADINEVEVSSPPLRPVGPMAQAAQTIQATPVAAPPQPMVRPHEITAAPAPAPTFEPIQTSTPEPVTASAPEPVAASAPEPVAAPAPEPVAAPAPEPVQAPPTITPPFPAADTTPPVEPLITNAEVLHPDEPKISTETDSFAEVLSRVAFQAHMTDEQEAAQRAAAADQARHLADEALGRPAFLDTTIIESTLRDEPPAQEPVVDAQSETAEPAAPEPELSEIAVEEIAVEEVDEEPEVDTTAHADITIDADVPSHAEATEPQDEVLIDDVVIVHDIHRKVITPASGITIDLHGRHDEITVPSHRTRISDHPLAALGLPTEFIPVGVEMHELQEVLKSALERMLPHPPVVRPSKGSIIAVVGERFDAMDVAEELAEQFGRPTEEIVLASQTYRGKGAANVLRTVRNAEDAQRSWSRRPRPTIVAIEANPGSRDTSWAQHLLTALEPIATYGVTDATRKSDDIKSWADSLGGLDCLAINNVDATVSPAAVLATGIPVDRVDGHRISPGFWALLLTERLLAA